MAGRVVHKVAAVGKFESQQQLVFTTCVELSFDDHKSYVTDSETLLGTVTDTNEAELMASST